MIDVITEITPLSERDCFYLVDRQKDAFSYPLHKHDELELNFIENCNGAKRIVGDSIEQLENYDLVLIGGGLEHAWEQGECNSTNIREITIQFSPDLLGESLLEKNQMASLKKLMQNAQNGIAFEMPTIIRLYDRINEITRTQPGFYRVLKLFEVLYELSLVDDYHLLTSSAFAHVHSTPDSRRVKKVEEFIDKNFRDEIRLQQLAEIASMTPTAFSRFFRLRTGKSISDYVIDVRLGHAARMLADSTNSVVEICYDCGFNNVSNFNRIFKKKKGCTPSAFRENYHKNKVII